MRSAKGGYDALLLDLDGTLLDIDLDRFIPAYVKALARRFDNLVGREKFIDHLFGATAKTVENSDPGRTNREVFYEEFCAGIGLRVEDIEPLIAAFYREDFPRFSCWGRKPPHTAAVMEAALEKSIPVVLATNPIFPESAVHQRMSWAGLAPDQFVYITTMDNMHFCKPKPEYYLEVSRVIGIDPERCLMAGNDTLEDLAAAGAGMDTFLVEDYLLDRRGVDINCSYRGSLKNLARFIENL